MGEFLEEYLDSPHGNLEEFSEESLHKFLGASLEESQGEYPEKGLEELLGEITRDYRISDEILRGTLELLAKQFFKKFSSKSLNKISRGIWWYLVEFPNNFLEIFFIEALVELSEGRYKNFLWNSS